MTRLSDEKSAIPSAARDLSTWRGRESLRSARNGGPEASSTSQSSFLTDCSPAATRLYLVRHGETDWNRLGLLQGTTDTPLNGRGREQARQLAGRLDGVRFHAAYTSPLRRARETVEEVLRDRSEVPLRVLQELREMSYGLWQGRSLDFAGRRDPGLEWRWRHDPWRVRFPGGESLPEVEARAAAALRLVVAAHPGESVLVCGHGHLNRVLLIHALRWPRERFWEIGQENGCCYQLLLGSGRARLYTGEESI